MVKGISVSNPVDFEENYLHYTAEYAAKHGFTHYQFIGSIHNPEKGNIDGITLYRKYSAYNGYKNAEYVGLCGRIINETLEFLHAHGIKSYIWHHELELPAGFTDDRAEMKNELGDVEITHPLVKDFLVNKIDDFFAAYPLMDGIILTLHETRIPLLKLKGQKLHKTERVEYVTRILYEECARLKKELIVRPFASIEEDYERMTAAYERISSDLIIMDKWNQFDWSLTLPANAFFAKIKRNPLLVETDIFGEFFGKGILPIMLKNYITDKFSYSMKFSPYGFVSRIDREGFTPFGTVQEVNLRIMEACLANEDIDRAIDEFFLEKYPNAAKEVRALMENTEDIQKKIFYVNGFYYTELSRFPRLNHSKNHFYFEMMKENYAIASNEWFIPKNWSRGSVADVLKEKTEAVSLAAEKLAALKTLKDKLPEAAYDELDTKFINLKLVAEIWKTLTECFIAYTKYFENGDKEYENSLNSCLNELNRLYAEGIRLSGDKFYPIAIGEFTTPSSDRIPDVVNDFKANFEYEKAATERLVSEKHDDFIICGGGTESHKLQKEVNFSDTYINSDGCCRIPGTYLGAKFSTVNTHGWFSYEIKIKPNTQNLIRVTAKGYDGQLDFILAIGDDVYKISKQTEEKCELEFKFDEKCGKDKIRIRVDRSTQYTPAIYLITVN